MIPTIWHSENHKTIKKETELKKIHGFQELGDREG